jgi:hypothetical protein
MPVHVVTPLRSREGWRDVTSYSTVNRTGRTQLRTSVRATNPSAVVRSGVESSGLRGAAERRQLRPRQPQGRHGASRTRTPRILRGRHARCKKFLPDFSFFFDGGTNGSGHHVSRPTRVMDAGHRTRTTRRPNRRLENDARCLQPDRQRGPMGSAGPNRRWKLEIGTKSRATAPVGTLTVRRPGQRMPEAPRRACKHERGKRAVFAELLPAVRRGGTLRPPSLLRPISPGGAGELFALPEIGRRDLRGLRLTRFFAEPAARENVRSSEEWKRV